MFKKAIAKPDSSVGNIIAEAMEKVGRDGVITEEGQALQDELDVVEGSSLTVVTFLHTINNQEAGSVELENPFILLIDKKVSTFVSYFQH